MCQEVFQIAMSMDLKSVEMQLALQCAPLITGARISNMLMIDSTDESAMRVILRASGISHFRLAARNEKTAFLLFRRSLLEAYLNNSEALDILKKAGYEDFSFGKILLRFKKHYEAYLNDEHKQFPHEMGLLLGYPIEDVRGFIEHNGCGCLYSGYWKVYRNVPLKKKMFEDFEKAKESVIQLLAEDIDMRLILEIYKEERLVQIACEICRWHHERYDGSGYPDGLKGEEIPIAAQVVSIVDVYDALTSPRVYKKAYSHEKAMQMILTGECGVFQPLLLDCFYDIQEEVRKVTQEKSEKEGKISGFELTDLKETLKNSHLIGDLKPEKNH